MWVLLEQGCIAVLGHAQICGYPAPLEIETTPTTWSEEDRGGGHGTRIDRAN